MGTGLMSIGMKAMFANSAALNVTGHNIANASVAGYSRQQVELETAKGQFTGAGFFGQGVSVANVTRAHDQFLTMQAAAARSMASMDGARRDQLNQLQDVFPSGAQGLGYAMGDFLNAMSDLASTPADGSARQVVLARARDVASRYSSAASRIDMLQAGVRSDMETSVKTVNGLSDQIAKLNDQIAQAHGLNQQPNDLLDQRDQLVAEIGKYVQVTTMPASDGSMGVFIAGGQRLVLGNEANKLMVQQDPADGSRSVLALETPKAPLTISQDMLTGGSLAGLMRYQNTDIVDARNQLGQMAGAFASEVNKAQSLGLDLRNPPGTGAPLFSIGAPQAMANANNLRDASGNPVTPVALTVVDARQIQASDYDLHPDGSGVPGQYTLVRLSDGVSRSVLSGDTVDGMRIDIGPPDMAATDRFLLRPAGGAASNMRVVLDDPNGIAAASPVTATVGASNTGTAQVASLQVVDSSIDPNLSASISFTSATGDYNWELRDAGGTLVSSGSATWQAGQPIKLNGFELQLSGVPASGDTMSVVKTAFPASNNGNALQMSALRDAPIVLGKTVTDAYASTMADIGVRVQSANTSATISDAASTQADQQLTSKTGVNLDEEASRLIQFQQGYQAAAKVLQVAQSVFDTMLQLGGH
jgi:flagellar hook-associated protein 1 FlgK